MKIRRFFVILIFMFQIFKCRSTEEVFHEESIPEEQQFVPGRRDILMNQQTEAIRRIVHAKSLELQKPFDIDDSLLLTRCQQIANQQRSNAGRLQAEALTNEEFEQMTTIKNDEKVTEHGETTKINDITTKKSDIVKEKVEIIEPVQDVPKEVIKSPTDQIESQSTQIVDKVDVQTPIQVPPTQTNPNQVYSGPPLYYIYPQYIQNIPEQISDQSKLETSTVSSTTTTSTSTTTASPAPPLFTEKLRFVLRLPLPQQEKLATYPYEFDRYAYFPKSLQPSLVNMAVPYTPTYHMIRRLVIPSKVPSSYIVETNK